MRFSIAIENCGVILLLRRLIDSRRVIGVPCHKSAFQPVSSEIVMYGTTHRERRIFSSDRSNDAVI